MSADQKRVQYYSQQMEAGYRFMQEMMRYPVAECGEPLESLVDAAEAAGVDVAFSTTPIVADINRMFLLRCGLIVDFIAIAREMNERGWVLKVEDGYRTCQMQKMVSRKPVVFDSILQWTMWELGGKIPDVKLLVKRVASMTASCPKVGTHMSGSAIDMSVLHRDDRSELDRGAPYLAMCDLTPMASPFISVAAQQNRAAITGLMAKHGFVAYPWEFWHYNKGDAYAEYLLK
ncbi:MAG: M15 family metallopeptidase, partial [Verrucomicrobiota bacterium]